jgi:hypothetical protein
MAALKSRFRAGENVRIADRAATAQDMKTGLFFNHFRGLVGSIQKVYGAEASVEIDLDALPEDIWKRHMQTRDQMRERWLEGMAADVRRKLTPEEKQFDLRYVVLVAVSDIERPRAQRVRKPVS